MARARGAAGRGLEPAADGGRRWRGLHAEPRPEPEAALLADALARNAHAQLAIVGALGLEEGVAAPEEVVAPGDARGLAADEGLLPEPIAKLQRLPHAEVVARPVHRGVGLGGEEEPQRVGVPLVVLVPLPPEVHVEWHLGSGRNVDAEDPLFVHVLVHLLVLLLPDPLDGLVAAVDKLLQTALHRDLNDLAGQLLVLLCLLCHLQECLHGIKAGLLVRLFAMRFMAHEIALPVIIILPACGLI
mmetsp:Transcript_27285/g.78391  ORF Transcript_27285/g.78391 Transcript_27285/m.78391 type:complete len:244 (-) Transcript_27285:498-1229(-)